MRSLEVDMIRMMICYGHSELRTQVDHNLKRIRWDFWKELYHTFPGIVSGI